MDQLLKIFEVIMNFTAAKSQTVSSQLLESAKRTLLYGIVALGAVTLFCVGISMALTELAQQLDKPILVGSLLALSSVGVIIFCFSQKPWVNTPTKVGETNSTQASPIEDALALLIKDIVEERHSKRVSTQSNESHNP